MVLVVVGLVGGCTRTESGPAQTGVESPKSAAAKPSAAGRPDSPHSPRFWVANSGLAAHDLDGKRVQQLGTASIDEARRLADGRIVGLREMDEALTLVVLAADGSVQREVALPNALDPDACTIAAPGDGSKAGELLHTQSTYDFQVSASAACLSVLDRNENMADYAVSLVVDIETGGVAGVLGLSLNDDCQSAKYSAGEVHGSCDNSSTGHPWIDPMPSPPPNSTAWPHDFDELAVAVTGPGEAATVLCEPGAEPELGLSCADIIERSPSGRWVLLSGRQFEGDYIHRELLLLDRANGQLLQIELRDNQPARLITVTAAELFAEDRGDKNFLDVVGESDFGWLPKDRLWLDGMLLIPERREIVQIGGTRVRTLE